MHLSTDANILLEKIRHGTRHLHGELERVYPYNKLQGNDVSVDDLRWFFTHMWTVFNPLLATSSHPLFAEKKAAMESFVHPLAITADEERHSLALQYVFIGSLLGGAQVIQKNPKIKDAGALGYFSTDRSLLSSAWSELLRELQAVPPHEERRIVEDCAEIFGDLVRLAKNA